jgi:hypothetical protein
VVVAEEVVSGEAKDVVVEVVKLSTVIVVKTVVVETA